MICFVNMPSSSIMRPSLALAQFQAQLNKFGMVNRLFNLNISFAEKIGVNQYETLCRTVASEWIFAGEAWRSEIDLQTQPFLDAIEIDPEFIKVDQNIETWLQKLRCELVPQWLDESVTRILEEGVPDLVAFSCTFYQTVSSLALARKLKEKCPNSKTVFGGSSFHGEMGLEIILGTPWVDIVCTGEADATIIDVCRAVLNKNPPANIDGIHYRSDDGSVVEQSKGCPTPRAFFKELPEPDYDTFYTDILNSPLFRSKAMKQSVFLLFEGARGCWWGKCHFCGLNAEYGRIRFKPVERILTTLLNFTLRYPQIKMFEATDNALTPHYFQKLLPAITQEPLLSNKHLFYEIKTNITREMVYKLVNARVTMVQPGIESLSTHLLECLGKGTTMLQNVYCLKLLRTYGITCGWNILFRIPGEHASDYSEMAGLIPKLFHLSPPSVGPVQLHRFSTYYREFSKFTKWIKPKVWYRDLFPQQRFDYTKLAYFFDTEWRDICHDTDTYQPLVDAVWRWLGRWSPHLPTPELKYHYLPDGTCNIIDSRVRGGGQWKLNQEEVLVYEAINDPATLAEIEAQVGRHIEPNNNIEFILTTFVQNGLAISEGEHYLGLSIPEKAPPLSDTSIQNLQIEKLRTRQIVKNYCQNPKDDTWELLII